MAHFQFPCSWRKSVFTFLVTFNLFFTILFTGCTDEATNSISDLENNNSVVRMRAAELLGKSGDVRAIKPLILTLADSDQHVQAQAREALIQIGEPALLMLSTSLNSKNIFIRYQSKSILDVISPDWRQSKEVEIAFNGFIAALKHVNPGVRMSSVAALGELGNSRAVEFLVVMLVDEKSQVRKEAAKALARLDPGWRNSAEAINMVPEFITTLKNNNSTSRELAHKALEEIGDADTKLLIANLKNKDSEIRRQAIFALSGNADGIEKFCDKVTIEVLISALKDDDPLVRKNAILVLEKTKAADAIAPIVEALRDSIKQVRRCAQKALKNLGEIAVPSLIAALDDSEFELIKNAALLLSEIGGERAIKSLFTELERSNFAVVIGSYPFYIRAGQPGSESVLVAALYNFGNTEMAIDFLNCGNKKLTKAAENWAKKNGFKLYAYKVGNSENIKGPQWGIMRKIMASRK